MRHWTRWSGGGFLGALVATVILLAALGSGACKTAAQYNQAAADDTRTAVFGYLSALSDVAPDQATKDGVNTVVRNWDSQSEAQNLSAAQPYLEQYARLRPAEADAVNRVLRRWRARVLGNP